MLLTWMEENLWLALIVWIVLYISDYSLTLLGARMRAERGTTAVSTQGSYELNNYFVKDIDARRVVSARFIAALAYTTFLLGCSWLLARLYPIGIIVLDIVIGALVLMELTIHLRHFRNLFGYRHVAQAGEITGSVIFSRRYVMWASSLDLFLFALLYLVLFLFVGNLFFLGGAVGCAGIAIRHRLRIRREPRLATTV